MDAQFVRPADKIPPPRPPLITPSASPPVSRIRDRPPAAKRPRLSSTPSTSSSVQRSSSAATISDAERLRLESLDRLFKTWDQLADRYHKPLDEDDIVDLRDLSILKDRGVTRGIARTYAIGSMIVPTDEASSQGGDDDNVVEEDEEESADELDLISGPPVPPVPEEYKTWFVPPADQTNPDDAEMFREFEEAEKMMRERYGLEEEDEEEAAPEKEPDVESEPPLEDDEREEDEEVAPRPPSPKPTPQRRKSRPPPKTPGDDSSEDEFATWDFDETPVPRSVLRSVPPPPDDDIIDLTESPVPSPPKPKPPQRGRSKSRPPQLDKRARSRARSKSKPPVATESHVNTSEIEEPSVEEQQVLQLLTPPRSSSAAESIPNIQDHEPAPLPPPPAETPSPKLPKPRARYTPRPRTPSDDEEGEEMRLPPPSLKTPMKVGPPRGVKKQRSFKGNGLRPEVVLTLRPKKSKGKTKSTRPPSPEPPSSPSPQASKSKKGKGKEKEVPEPPSSTSAERAPKTPRRRRSQSQPRAVTRESDSPQPLPPPRGTKRRRVSSLSPLSDSSPARPVTPDPVAVPLSAAQTKRLTHSGSSRSGYSSDIPPPTSSPVHSDADDDNDEPRRAGRGHPHPRPASLAPPMSSYPYPPPVFAHYTPRHDNPSSASAHRHPPNERHATPFQDPQAQLMFAHAWHSLSYLVASGAIPAPPPPGAGYPPGLPFPPAPWPPYTPSHQRHRTHPFDTPSHASEAGPSRSSTYFTPTHHPHPYPHSYDPMFSNGTLPPSSPIPSSPATSSPALRPASVPPGQRSRSRGRRVSFKLDANDRPLPPTPPQGAQNLFDDAPSTSKRAGPSGTSNAKGKGKGKGKARAEPEPEPERREEEESSDDSEPPPRPPRGRALRRASTPGPPSQREKSAPPAGSASTSSGPKGNKTPKSASKRKN